MGGRGWVLPEVDQRHTTRAGTPFARHLRRAVDVLNTKHPLSHRGYRAGAAAHDGGGGGDDEGGGESVGLTIAWWPEAVKHPAGRAHFDSW